MLIEMMVTGLTLDPFTNTPIVILKDKDGKNAIPIWIGLIEASAIATELEKIQLTRPMTHDLIKNLLETLNAVVSKIVVSDLRDNTYYALIFLRVDSKEFSVDSRPSDAIAIALRTGAPIMVDEKVIEKSKKIDLKRDLESLDDETKKKKWAELLETMKPEDFKYKM